MTTPDSQNCPDGDRGIAFVGTMPVKDIPDIVLVAGAKLLAAVKVKDVETVLGLGLRLGPAAAGGDSRINDSDSTS